jgi:MOSC domain-containing protein YiiM
MTKVGTLFSLFYADADGRSRTESLSLDLQGIIQDKHYNKDIERSVLIASLESYSLASEHSLEVPEGALGENLLIDYNPYALPAGSRLALGDTVLEISQHCTLCKSFAKVDPRLPKLLKEDRGVFAKVIHAGTIRQGDTIYLLD